VTQNRLCFAAGAIATCDANFVGIQ